MQFTKPHRTSVPIIVTISDFCCAAVFQRDAVPQCFKSVAHHIAIGVVRIAALSLYCQYAGCDCSLRLFSGFGLRRDCLRSLSCVYIYRPVTIGDRGGRSTKSEFSSPPLSTDSTIKLNELFCEVELSPRQPPFHIPDDDFDDWAFKVKIYSSPVNYKLHRSYIPSFLGYAAVKQFRASGVAPDLPPKVIWETLQALFGRTELAPVYRERFHARHQQTPKSVDSSFRDLRELALIAFPQSSPAEEDCLICDRFCLGLSYQELREKVLRTPASPLIKAVEKARAFEAVQKSMRDTPSVTEPMCFATGNFSKPSSPASNCVYRKRFGSHVQKCGHNQPLAAGQVTREITSPLHQHTEKGKKFECHAAFNTHKDKLSSPPILAFPDISPSAGPFILHNDASDLAIGAELSQKSASGEVLIAHASCRLDKQEIRYCTTRREMLALV
ncbi:uncharacterized protein DEA37_0011994 [Paragonimus westermani]|uniref:Reverse transcriptase/retrotransposon-derived protein RNase H-like domain-containing protein n=1 Tax=Paragonimus westermani TaxID=34504 RepID=A0A5J4NHY7_9TREM|nr:uncharacterized protein DEA37_0011994 [Paragonimus westermani]